MRRTDPFFCQVVPDDFGKTRQMPPRGSFFGNLIKTVGRIGGALLGIPAAAPVVAKVAPTAVQRIARAALPVVGGVGLGAVGAALLPGTVAAPAGAVGVRKLTIIQTLDATGAVVQQEIKQGAPFLMKTDLVTAKRVFKMSTKLHGKLPRRTVKESDITSLKNELIRSALRGAAQPCLPKPC